jgi:hypothetical protein
MHSRFFKNFLSCFHRDYAREYMATVSLIEESDAGRGKQHTSTKGPINRAEIDEFRGHDGYSEMISEVGITEDRSKYHSQFKFGEQGR